MYTSKKREKSKQHTRKYGKHTVLNKKAFHEKKNYRYQSIFIHYAIYKKCAAKVNAHFKVYTPLSISKAIVKACNQIIYHYKDSDFPIHLLQSHTNINMNVNELVAKKASTYHKTPIDPLHHVNKSQSSNDSFYTVATITICIAFKKLIKQLEELIRQCKVVKRRVKGKGKKGKTHLVDAIDIDYSDIMDGYIGQLHQCLMYCTSSLNDLYEIPAGLTMIGSGDNAPRGFSGKMIQHLKQEFGLPLRKSKYPFTSMSSFNAIAKCNQTLALLASNLKKIVFDVNVLYGYNRITIPKISIGSSFLHSKVNCTICDSIGMKTIKIMGNAQQVIQANAQGNFQLNVYIPMITYNTLESIDLLDTSIHQTYHYLLKDIKVTN